jgi:ribosomal-protein-alanine N-acetyltransferase
MVRPVTIRPPKPTDQAMFLAAVRRSCKLHHPWVQPPKTAAAVRAFLTRPQTFAHRTFLIVAGRKSLVGVVNVSEIVRGSFQSAYLGYYAFVPFAHRGFMRAGLIKVIDHCFTALALHRLEANIQPANEGSIALVRRLGFVQEGFSRRYLKVAGRWRDHERWAILADDWRV